MIDFDKLAEVVSHVGLLDLAGSIMLIVASVFLMTAALGTLWLKDSLQRMAAISKGAIGGAIVIALAVGLNHNSTMVWWQIFLVISFLILTMPIASQLIGRAAYRHSKEIDPSTNFSPDATPQTWPKP